MRKSYKFAKRKKAQAPRYNINRRIRSDEVRLIDENEQMVGIVPTDKALEMAQEAGLDLVEVSPVAKPPVAKIMDYGQFQYQQEKQQRKQKSVQKRIETKGVRLSFKISDHDKETKAKQATRFLNQGHKVKIECILRGRENRHVNLAKELVNDFVQNSIDTPHVIEQPVAKQGNKIFMIIMPEKN